MPLILIHCIALNVVALNDNDGFFNDIALNLARAQSGWVWGWWSICQQWAMHLFGRSLTAYLKPCCLVRPQVDPFIWLMFKVNYPFIQLKKEENLDLYQAFRSQNNYSLFIAGHVIDFPLISSDSVLKVLENSVRYILILNEIIRSIEKVKIYHRRDLNRRSPAFRTKSECICRRFLDLVTNLFLLSDIFFSIIVNPLSPEPTHGVHYIKRASQQPAVCG